VVGEIGDIAGGREDAAVVLARKLLTRMFEVTGARCESVDSLQMGVRRAKV
jgi:hypothetical protein